MAFCSKCGNQLTEGARFCTACGERTGAVATTPETSAVTPPIPPAPKPGQPQPGFPQSVAAPKKRSSLVWIVPVLIVGLVLLGAAGWFGISLLTGGTQSSRARAQAEAVADYLEGYTAGDLEMVRGVVPEDLRDLLDAEEVGTDESVSVDREWDGDVLLVTATSEEYDWSTSIEVTADGGRRRGIVIVADASDEDAESEIVVEREGGRWVIVEIDGEEIGDVFGVTSESDDGSASGSFGDAAQECWRNQRTLEGAAQQYYAAHADNYFEDLEGQVDDMHLLAGVWVAQVPLCPTDGSYYWMYDDGTTDCPSGEHGYYGNEQ
jgi:hypothetical protein